MTQYEVLSPEKAEKDVVAKRVKSCCANTIKRHKEELFEINELLFHIKESEFKHMNWVKTRLYARIDELEIAINSTSHAPWTNYEIKWIRDNYHNTTARELAIDMQRSTGTVQRMITALKIKKIKTT